MTSNTAQKSNDKVYKVVPEPMWMSSCEKGIFEGSLDDRRDGFIHLSSAPQLLGTLNKYFRGQSDLVLIAFERNTLAQNLRWEVSRNGELFPHYYGALPTNLAVAATPLGTNADGDWTIDEDSL